MRESICLVDSCWLPHTGDAWHEQAWEVTHLLMVPGQQPKKRQSLSRGLTDAGCLLHTSTRTCISGVPRCRHCSEIYFTWTQRVNVHVEQATAELQHLSQIPTPSPSSPTFSPSNHLWALLPGDSGIPQGQSTCGSKFIRCHLSGTWHLAWSCLPAAQLCSSISALVFKGTHLVLPFANRPLQIREKEACRKLETVSLRAANAPNQGCGEYMRPWL